MAIEVHIKHGDEALQKKDYLGAVSCYKKALQENPKAFMPHLKRATAYQRLGDYDKARSDITAAFEVAEDRGKRSDIGLCYFRLGLLYYSEKKYKLSQLNFQKAKDYDCTEASIEAWLNKVAYDVKKNPQPEEEDESDLDGLDLHKLSATESSGAPQTEDASKSTSEASTKAPEKPSSTSIDAINQHAPIKMKIRTDWYQSKDSVTIDVFAKGINKDKLNVDIKPNSLSVSFPSSASTEYSYILEPLHATIDAEKSSYRVLSTKLEITLVKTVAEQWPALDRADDEPAKDASVPSYPTSAKKKTNWNSLELDDDGEEQNSDPNAFFQKLYKDCDEDTRRAMMKSYIQSNGTVLTTSWDEAKEKEFEVSPPEGMEEKKW
ncbi:hypothetical protein DIURU_002192 [Diutina rugosa]|uniref:CS domain-containing protein n=1 Tax=Diutina rugosa TaxID=5481 RepID=A0A642UQV6_DIURU|nr:uncharacterized protein DIURU_002192 [Diutina rugosa]KAA8903681.1 hypothetical protein DIURU_002192 [Diutina rugosa]